jgi:hypothetical protein
MKLSLVTAQKRQVPAKVPLFRKKFRTQSRRELFEKQRVVPIAVSLAALLENASESDCQPGRRAAKA